MRFCVLALAGCLIAAGQAPDPDPEIYTEHPRLLLNARRLRLLKRERERTSPRWRQFEALVRGGAQMAEPGFALALFHQVTGDPEIGRAAVRSAMHASASIRDVALVADWCHAVLTDADRSALDKRLRQFLAQPAKDFQTARDYAFASLALGDGRALGKVVHGWWRKSTAPELNSGTRAISHRDFYPFVELAHAVRDNLQIDVRDDIPAVFRDLALERVLSYYPAPWPAAENDYRIPWFTGKGDPDLRIASLTRAGEMALVGFEANAQEMQFLQGWIMHDRFVLRGPFGVPYEFLWANPYQPGLPFEKLPLRFHNPRTGMLLARSDWEESATWVGWFGQSGQMFSDGRIQTLNLTKPIEIGESVLLTGNRSLTRFEAGDGSPPHWYVIGLKPRQSYDIEIDGEGMIDAETDAAGVLALELERRSGQSVFIHEPRRQAATP
jgi:hypothetical protein